MAITSDEVNYLVYRYLQESGFMHSAFTFAYESQLAQSTVIRTELPPGALVSFLQKGLQYVGIEAHINEDGTERECEGAISLLSPHVCKVAQSTSSSARSSSSSSAKASNKRKRKTADGTTPTPTPTANREGGKAREGINGVDAVTAATTALTLDQDAMVLLSGHEKEVYGCLWHPQRNVLVSGSSDSTARLWEMPPSASVKGNGITTAVAPTPTVLHHGTGPHKDVTTLEWNPDGSLLASGTYNGKTRIWSAAGELKHAFQFHNGPVFATRWSKAGSFLLSASFDKTVSIWDVATTTKRQQMKLHDDPILDASWKDDATFATCSADKRICITNVDDAQPSVVLRGHTDAINSVKWDPSGRLLASCSDDYTVKIWDPSAVVAAMKNGTTSVPTDGEDAPEETNPAAPSSTSAVTKDTTASSKSMCLHSFQDHKKEVYTFRWSCTGPGSALPNGPLTLASASFDTTVKLWDLETGTCSRTFEHQHPVYGVAYSPNGEFLASGTIKGIVNVWSLKDGTLLKTYQVNGDIYEVNWNKDGDLISACASSGDVALINFRL